MATRRETIRRWVALNETLRCNNSRLFPSGLSCPFRELIQSRQVLMKAACDSMAELMEEGMHYTIPQVRTFAGQTQNESDGKPLFVSKKRIGNSFMVQTTRGGFSLVEMLTIISIITILAAILFPVFSRVRDKARSSSCQSNLKQLGLAVQQYTQDYDGHFMAGTRDFGALGAYSGIGWAGQLVPYVKSAQLFTCPSDPTIPVTGKTVVSYVYSYSMARSWNTAVEADVQTEAKLSEPSRTVLMVEVRALRLSLVPGETDSPTSNLAESFNSDFFTATGPVPNAPASRDCAPDAARRCSWDQEPRHLGGANYLAADGHVKWFPPSAISSGRPAQFPTALEVYPFKIYMRAEGTAVQRHAMTMSPM